MAFEATGFEPTNPLAEFFKKDIKKTHKKLRVEDSSKPIDGDKGGRERERGE